MSLEVDQPDQVERCRDEVASLTGGKLDYLVNNAGRSSFSALSSHTSQLGSSWEALEKEVEALHTNSNPDYTIPALDATLPEIQSTFSTNLFAVMHICTVFSPLLVRSRGTIVQIGSIAAIIPYAFGSVYNASKAALHSYSDSLRVELAPFGVSVITVVTGGVKSNIARTERVLPEGSLYADLEENYQRRQKYSQEVGMDNAVYARKVVGEVLAGDGWIWKRRTIWAGGSANMVKWVSMFLGTESGLWDWLMTRMFGLGRLYQKDFKKKEL